jgi:hypothetical protein
MNLRNIFAGILFGIFISSCSDTPPTSAPNSTTTTSTTSTQKPQLVKLYLTVLDCNNDTIDSETPFEMGSLFSSNEFQTEGHYTISYEQFQQLDPHITGQCMAQYGIQKYINQVGQIALIKRDFKNSKYPKFKTNYVQNINWLKVNATQISPNLMCCGICSNEWFEYCNNAVKNNLSYAQMCANAQLEHPDSIPFDEYMKQAKDSLFTEGYYEDTYYLTYGKDQEDSFFIHDLGIIADINGDGYADRVASWSYNVSGGICDVTKKSSKGLIELFEY